MSKDFFLIAEIKSVLNKEGYLGLTLYSDFPKRFYELRFVFVEVFGGKRKFFVEDFNLSDKGASVKFLNFDSDSDVKFLLRKKIFVDEENLAEKSEREYFIHDLIDCEVFSGNEFFGKMKNVEQYPGNDVFVIEKENGEEILIPFVEEFVKEIDIKKKKVFLKSGIEFDDDTV